MAECQFQDVVNGITINRRIPAPKVATMKAWLKQARAFIPQIPSEKSGFHVFTESCDLKWIKFELHDLKGNRVHVVINRSVPAIG